MIVRGLLGVLWLVAAMAAGIKVAAWPGATTFTTATAAVVNAAPPAPSSARFITAPNARAHVHASSLVALNDGRVRAVWFSGSREGGADVTIQSSVYDAASNGWSAEQTVATRAATQAATLRATRKLGNPVIARHSDGRLWLFYVSVAIGGWAGSSLNAMVSSDEGASWSAPTRLITTPFFNLSTLVRTPPVLGADGTMLLPVYHEFLGKFAEILRIDRAGQIIDKQRLSWGRGMLQPVLLPASANDALVLMRTSGSDLPHRTMASRTHDAGRHWSTPSPMELPNPDSALAGVVLANGVMLAIYNDSESLRNVLALAASTDAGKSWRALRILEDERSSANLATVQGKFAARTAAAAGDQTSRGDNARLQMCVNRSRCRFEFSYPSMVVTNAGDLHVTYTWHRSAIKHVLIDRAALEDMIYSSTADASCR